MSSSMFIKTIVPVDKMNKKSIYGDVLIKALKCIEEEKRLSKNMRITGLEEEQKKLLEKEIKKNADDFERLMCVAAIIHSIGYDYKETKIFYDKKKTKDGKIEWIPIKKTETIKHQPGNASQYSFFMTNRFPEHWKLSREILTGKIPGYDETPGERDRKKIEALARDVSERNTDSKGAKSVVQG